MKKILAILLWISALGFSNWWYATHPGITDSWLDQIVGQSILEIVRLVGVGGLGAFGWGL